MPYSIVGLYEPKKSPNVGGVLRAAHIFGVNAIYIEGGRFNRFRHYVGDTTKALRHVPLYTTEILYNIPENCTPVVVEVLENSIPLPEFQHPSNACYIFGPEDGSVPTRISDFVEQKVSVPTNMCMNLSACVNVVLYDRMAKEHRKELRSD